MDALWWVLIFIWVVLVVGYGSAILYCLYQLGKALVELWRELCR